MNSKRLHFILLGAICLMLAGLLGGAYLVDKLLTNASQQLVAKRLDLAVYTQQEQDVAQAKQDVQKYQEFGTIAQSVVPQDKDQAQTVGEIVSIAGAYGISLSSITFPASTLGATSGANVSQLTPVKNIAGVYSLQLTVQSDTNKPVPYNSFIAFLNALEHNRRTALVQSITIQPNDKDRSTLSFTLILAEYIKP